MIDLAQHTIDKTKKYATDEDINTPAKLASHAILADCLDRGGIKHEFRACDDEVIVDILQMWEDIIEKVMTSRA